TVVIALIAVALSAVLALQRMPMDIFPQVGDPVIYVSQPYGGMDPQQMEGYLTYYYEYHFLYITGIDRVESRSLPGQALLKLVFHPGTDMAQAMGETMSYVTRAPFCSSKQVCHRLLCFVLMPEALLSNI